MYRLAEALSSRALNSVAQSSCTPVSSLHHAGTAADLGKIARDFLKPQSLNEHLGVVGMLKEDEAVLRVTHPLVSLLDGDGVHRAELFRKCSKGRWVHAGWKRVDHD